MDILVKYNSLNLSFDEIREMIEYERYYKYYQSLPSDPRLEDDKNHGVPLMNKIFYEQFILSGKIPHWKDFCNMYANTWCTVLPDGNLTFKSDNPKYQYTFSKQALTKKLIRAYMSFLKELYVLYWFYNRGLTAAYYSLENDISGFDITIINRFSHLFGIKIYSNTSNANKFAVTKQSERNKLPENSTSISIRASDSIILGDTYVFSDKLLNGVYHYINNDIQKNIIF